MEYPIEYLDLKHFKPMDKEHHHFLKLSILLYIFVLPWSTLIFSTSFFNLVADSFPLIHYYICHVLHNQVAKPEYLKHQKLNFSQFWHINPTLRCQMWSFLTRVSGYGFWSRPLFLAWK